MKADELTRQEETRNQAYDPALRWQHLQERITWAEDNVVHRNTPARCVAEQRKQWPERDQPTPAP